VEKVIPVDLKIPGNPPTPYDILQALHGFMAVLAKGKK
jgi:Ni,Fe-hydrogenase III small subunit